MITDCRSAVDFVSRASGVRTITSRLGESYNIIGMDPRGVGSSGPILDCFDGNYALRDYFFNQQFMARFDYNSAVDMKYTFEESGAFGEWCTKKLPQSAKYANTPATAQDMLHYFEKAAEKDGKSAEGAKVNYYGVSYGSTLGMTFAQIYPERVGHFIIDGVMDFDDYYSGRYMHSMDQGDEAVEAFNTFCFEAGSKCAFFRDDASADAIKKRVDAILADVEETPIPVADPHWVQFPTVVNHIDVREYILGRVYSPMGTFPGLAVALSDLERRNGSRVASGKAVMPKAACDNASPVYNDRTALITITCVDTNGGFNFSSAADWDQYIEDIQEIGHYFGPNWGKVVGPNCRKLDLLPPKSQVWNGTSESSFYFPLQVMTTTNMDSGYKETKTNNPILFVTNVIDPVTPSHEKMSALFTGSVVLKQDAVGVSGLIFPFYESLFLTIL